jgi:hypothetical protein
MTHAEFLAAYDRREVRVEIDAKAAARFLSARLLLPFVMMPVLGIGVALALIGWFYTGLAVIAVAVVIPRLIKRGAPQFLLRQAIEDPSAYDALTRASVLRVAPFTGSERSAASTGG